MKTYKFIVKILAGMLMAAMIASLTACVSTEKSSDNTVSTSTNTLEQPKTEDGTDVVRPKITILTNINVDTEGTDVNNNDYIHYMEEKTGVDIELINDASSSYIQKLYTVMASNALPDAVMLMGTTQRADLARFAEEGLLMNLDNKIGNYTNLKKNIKQEAWDVAKYNGSIYAVPFQRFDPTPYMTFVRRNWMETLKIDPQQVVSIDDWYNMLKRFVTDDPDKNGQNDTVGMTSTTSGTHFTNSIFLDSFGAAKDKYIDGELLPNYLLPEYKEWLKFMNKLYKEKILDPNFIIDDPATLWDKTTSGKYGSFLWFWGLTEYLSKGYERSDYVAMKPPARKDGSEASYVYSSPNRHMMAVTADCKNVDAVLKVWDWACTDEGGIFIFAGIKDKDYTLENGVVKLLDNRKGKNIGWRQLTAGVQLPNVDHEPIYGILAQSYGEQGMQDLALATKCGSYNTLNLYCPTFTELSQYDFEKSVQEFTDRAIVGEIDIDAEWDSYVANWRKNGGNEKIRLSTEWYKKSEYFNEK